jgi:peptidyl-prolyl cis-trans isomerase A (cyclophilin A)
MRFALPLVAVLAFAADAAAFPQSNHPAMLDPSKATDKAPETFRAKFETTKGDIVFECTREWAPNGVDRFYNLVKIGFYDDVALFRVAKGFVVQWGIHGDPKVSAAWQRSNLAPDPPKQSNTRGMLTYAMGRTPDTRTTQVFINFADNKNLDQMGFAPICKVAEGMDVADSFYSEYGEAVTEKQGPITMQGNEYLKASWPKLDYIKTATIVGEAPSADRAGKSDGKPGEQNNSTLYWVIGGIVVVVIGGYFVMQKKEEPPKAQEKPKKKKRKKKTS